MYIELNLLQDVFLQDKSGEKEAIFLFLQYSALFCSAIEEGVANFWGYYLLEKRESLVDSFSSTANPTERDKILNELIKIKGIIKITFVLVAPKCETASTIVIYNIMGLYILFLFFKL